MRCSFRINTTTTTKVTGDNTGQKEVYTASPNIATARLRKEVTTIPRHRQTLVDSDRRLCKDATVLTLELSMNTDERAPRNRPKARQPFPRVVLSPEVCRIVLADPQAIMPATTNLTGSRKMGLMRIP